MPLKPVAAAALQNHVPILQVGRRHLFLYMVLPELPLQEYHHDKLGIAAVEEYEGNWVAMEMGNLLEGLVGKEKTRVMAATSLPPIPSRLYSSHCSRDRLSVSVRRPGGGDLPA